MLWVRHEAGLDPGMEHVFTHRLVARATDDPGVACGHREGR